MDVRYINPFIEAIKAVFTTMLGTDIVISKPFVKTNEHKSADVSAVIGLSGDATGCVALCFPSKSAIAVASKFADMELSMDHEDFADALGELANMVAGQAKAKLEGLRCSISLPTVIIGSQHVVVSSKAVPMLGLPCDSSLGRFSVEVALIVEKKPARQSPAMAGAER